MRNFLITVLVIAAVADLLCLILNIQQTPLWVFTDTLCTAIIAYELGKGDSAPGSYA